MIIEKRNIFSLGNNRKFLYGIFITLIIGIIGLSLISQYWNSNQKIGEINAKGNKYTSNKEILLYINPLIDNKLRTNVQLKDIEDRVNLIPFINSCDASFNFDNSISLKITERVPLAFLVNQSGDLNYVDKDAKILPHKLISEFSDLPFITGINANNDSKVLIKAIKIIEALNENKNSNANTFTMNLISEIKYDRNSKSFNLYSADNGIKILFGNDNDIYEKCNKFKIFYTEYLMKNRLASINHIDLRWKNEVVLL